MAIRDSVLAQLKECVRLLEAHPELFDERALTQIGVVSGLSVSVVRGAARGRYSGAGLVKKVADELLRAVAASAGLRRGQPPRGSDRAVLTLLGGLRRGYQAAVARLEPASSSGRWTLRDGEGRPLVESACPRCGVADLRDLAEPDACSECGFEFEALG